MIVLKQDSQRHKLACEIIRRTNFQDSYGVRFQTHRDIELFDAAKAMFTTLPDWVLGMFRIRDFIVKIIGLRGGSSNFYKSLSADNFRKEKKFGMWEIRDMNDSEVVFYEDDSHLDFTMSVILENHGENNYHLSASTRVRFKNSIGRWYFSIIKPFHTMIFKSMLKKSVWELKR